MPVTDLLERNHKLYGDEVALVELNPLMKDTRKTTWKEYDLVQQDRKSTRLNSSHLARSRMPSSA